jgi:NAD(P)-dependent dehydrogenase (short-subunit alcohol dehydrogenase family)
MAPSKVCLVRGAGDATAGAVARRIARKGYTACVSRRTQEKRELLLAQIRQQPRDAWTHELDLRPYMEKF